MFIATRAAWLVRFFLGGEWGGRDGAFYALDARDGKLLWQTNLGPSVASGPMTFSVAGKQYVSVQAGSSLFTFTLREF